MGESPETTTYSCSYPTEPTGNVVLTPGAVVMTGGMVAKSVAPTGTTVVALPATSWLQALTARTMSGVKKTPRTTGTQRRCMRTVSRSRSCTTSILRKRPCSRCYGVRQMCFSHEKRIYSSRACTTFSYCPHNEALSTTHIACHKNSIG